MWIAMNATMQDSIEHVCQSFEGLLPQSRLLSYQSMPQICWQKSSHAWRREAAERLREAFLSNLQPDFVHITSLFEGAQDDSVLSIGKFAQNLTTGVTLYDLIPLTSPKEYLEADWTKGWYLSKTESLRKADILLAISEHARREAMELLSIDGERIINISSAVSSEFKPAQISTADLHNVAERYGIVDKFVMYSGAVDPRKNVDRLINAFGMLPASIRDTYQLVLAGKVSQADKDRLEWIARTAGVEDRLIITGYISDSDLITLYRLTALYVFPSLHEGFGLPPLEAMACGAPTIGSCTTSIPEVIGWRDAMFDPTDVNEIAVLMRRALEEQDFNRVLREHALVQASKFSWDVSARRSIEAFEEVHARRQARSRSWAAGISLLDTNYKHLVESIAAIPVENTAPDRMDVVSIARAINENEREAKRVLRATQPLPTELKWRVEGPFDSSYSLALVNRELALALSACGNDIALHSTEGPGDFPADRDFLERNPDLARLHEREKSLQPEEADVCSRLLYPPRVEDMCSRFNLLHAYAWEESGFPNEWIEAFNESLQGISTLSTHVAKILEDNGIDVPLSISGCGVDHWARVTADLNYRCPGKSFRFLHVSSCFPRKGVDVLLRAYGDAFSATDDVSLIIKTFHNPHNEVLHWVDEARAGKNFPHVEVITDDLTVEQLKSLYEQCDAMVAPSRAEGFGLPLAEAILSGMPVITTNWGGQLDFCTKETAWLVDYVFAEAETHFELFNSVWAEPKREHLAKTLREVYQLPSHERLRRVQNGKDLLMREFKWSNVAQRLSTFVRELSEVPAKFSRPRFGWVSTWSTPCGIASYSAHLLSNMAGDVTVFAAHTEKPFSADGADIIRCWSSTSDDPLVTLHQMIEQAAIDVVVIQFQYAFFDFGMLSNFIHKQKRAGRVVVMIMHATQDSNELPKRRMAMLVDALGECDRILVHSVADMNRLKEYGLVENVAIFPHGILESGHLIPNDQEDLSTNRSFRISSYGFCLPHKGLPQLVEAIGYLVQRGENVTLKMINAEYPGHSRETLEQIEAAIEKWGVRDRVLLVTDYLSDEKSLEYLLDSDLIVFPYQGTGESASGAVRYGLATGRPVAVTPIPIFDDVKSAVLRLPGIDGASIANGIANIIANPEMIADVIRQSERWRRSHHYSLLGRRLHNLLCSLTKKRPSSSLKLESVGLRF
jgi:glycosyltransferase involved in cell wall biosynthesis